MTHDEFLRRYSHSFRYVDLWLSGWRPEDPLPEGEWGWLGAAPRRRVRLWLYPRDVVWAVRGRMKKWMIVRLWESLEQLVESQGEMVERRWSHEPYDGRGQFKWVWNHVVSEPVARGPQRFWSIPRYALPELIERIDDRAFWGYVFWLVMRGHPYCFDDYRISRMFDVRESEAAAARELMFDMGWFKAMQSDPRKHWWVREPKGVAMG